MGEDEQKAFDLPVEMVILKLYVSKLNYQHIS